jgi:hypothetical protein
MKDIMEIILYIIMAVGGIAGIGFSCSPRRFSRSAPARRSRRVRLGRRSATRSTTSAA